MSAPGEIRESISGIAEPLAAAGVEFAYPFGSRAKGEGSADSDADVAVMPSRELDLLERELLADRLARTMGVPDVDLVLLDGVGLDLRGEVVQEGRLIFSADEPGRVAFEVRARAEYLDFLPTLETQTRAYIHRVAERGLD